MSHWHRQEIALAVSIAARTSHSRVPSIANPFEYRRVGGYAHFNCAFIGCSWCLVIDSFCSRLDLDIATSLPGHRDCVEDGLSLKTMTDIIHNASYAHWLPSEGVHRHCSFPLSMAQLEGVPPLVLLDDNLQEIDQQAIEDQDRDGLDDEEYKILIGAASAIERKRKSSAS